MNKARWLTVALVLSLAINLMIVGVFIGRGMSGRPPPGSMPTNFGWMIRHLDDQNRQELRGNLEEHATLVQPIRREMRDAQRTFNRLLIQPELDEMALSASLQKLRTASDQYQTEMHAMMLQIVTQLDEQKRRKIASSLRRGPGRPGGPRRNMEQHRRPERRE